jgi:2',3'-cyclic-nucleotide 2'-phosphodiesterase / 3'-nucleotidase
MIRRRHLMVSAAALALTTAFDAGPLRAAAGASVQLRLLETTDLHMWLTDYDYVADRPDPRYGLARTATLIERARAERANCLLFDDGDLIEGNPLGDTAVEDARHAVRFAHPAFRVMEILHYDAGTLGNHEFNYGLDFLDKTLRDAPYPIVAANVLRAGSGRPYVPPYVILHRMLVDDQGRHHPIRVGVLGLVTPQIVVWDHANVAGRIVTRDIADTARRFVPEIRAEGADIVVVLAHSGLVATPPEPGEEHAVAALSRVPGIDAILFGHIHKVFPSSAFAEVEGVDLERGTINGVPATEANFWGSHLGVVDLSLAVDEAGHWRVIGGRGAAWPIARVEGEKVTPLVEPDPRIAPLIAGEHDRTVARLRQPIGATEKPLDTFFALVRPDETTRLIASAAAWYVADRLAGTSAAGLPVLAAASPMKAGGRMGPANYVNIPAGPLTLKDVAALYPYPNTLQAVIRTGAQIREWLEAATDIFATIDPAATGSQVLTTAAPSYVFDTIYGLTYAIDVPRPARYSHGALVHPDSHRIVDLRFQGAPLRDDRRFVVVANNYRISGGGSFPGLNGSGVVFSSPDTATEVIARYIEAGRPARPDFPPPWRFAPVAGSPEVVFDTAPEAAARAGSDPALVAVGLQSSGFLRYRVMLPRA